MWWVYPVVLVTSVTGWLAVLCCPPRWMHQGQRHLARLCLGGHYLHHRVRKHHWVRKWYCPELTPRGRLPRLVLEEVVEEEEETDDDDDDDGENNATFHSAKSAAVKGISRR